MRAACGEFVLQELTRRARAAGTPDLMREYLADPDGYRQQMQYMMRAMAEDSPAAQAFVDRTVGESEAVHRAGVAAGSMRESSDPRALAVLNVLISLATVTMPPALARALGQQKFGPDVLRRLAVPTLELYTYGPVHRRHRAADRSGGRRGDEQVMTITLPVFDQLEDSLWLTWCGRALDNRWEDPLLGDELADQIVRELDYDYRKLKITPSSAIYIAHRALKLDEIAQDFVTRHPQAVRAIMRSEGFDDPRTPESWNPKLRLVREVLMTREPEAEQFPAGLRWANRLSARSESLFRRGNVVLHYRF